MSFADPLCVADYNTPTAQSLDETRTPQALFAIPSPTENDQTNSTRSHFFMSLKPDRLLRTSGSRRARRKIPRRLRPSMPSTDPVVARKSLNGASDGHARLDICRATH